MEPERLALRFDREGARFKLAAEALRIRMAVRFDPMLAVTTSDLEPLPHQIQAVYGELIDRNPLRYVLADDPGAGKTIMAGLYVKELMLRGDLERCLIVAPGGLVDQWQDELDEKFGLPFTHLSRDDDASSLLIARMDQLARNEDLRRQVTRHEWDLVVVDEAHRMSASYTGDVVRKTRRYELGELLGRHTRHLLLMTATPHAGDETGFQLFMSLLDSDRFAGRYRKGVSSTDTAGLMRRMVKENLLTFAGKPLFPERRAYTVPYKLSRPERELYEAVTRYVREQMDKAGRLAGRRGSTVGFALTVLQRRLASSPQAILCSLERRHDRLVRVRDRPQAQPYQETVMDEEELTAVELEELEEGMAVAATAARTRAELEQEIAALATLTGRARTVYRGGTDTKWTQLNDLLQSNTLIRDAYGRPRKLIVFTEHRDTLDYLVGRIRSLIGREEAVVAIHGGVPRAERRHIQETFAQDKGCRVLVATDAAGEGLNLQRAHLMINYDLPWNPNRIEQRFGRIHRIGQNEVCHLWNLVADDTREGQVYHRLLDKIEEQRRAYSGKIFDVVGEAFAERPLRSLLMEAVQYGDRADVRERLNRIVDATVAEGVEKLLTERALAHESLGEADVTTWGLRMEEARTRRLQPHYVKAFFRAAFDRLGGRITEREAGRFEITHVPSALAGGAVLRRYERVTFDRELITVAGLPRADLLAPGHPLLEAVLARTIETYGDALTRGAVLVDAHDPGTRPRLLVAVSRRIVDGHQRVINESFDHVEIDRSGARGAGQAPYLDYRPATHAERGLVQVDDGWIAGVLDSDALARAVVDGVGSHLAELRARVRTETSRVRSLVRLRLKQEINYWYGRYAELLDDERSGKDTAIRPETARKRAQEMEERLARRMADLDADETLTARPPSIAGVALVIPRGPLDRAHGAPEPAHARETERVERRAVDRVLAEERRLGRKPEEMPRNNPGYDIRSLTGDGRLVFIEVKGRVTGSYDFNVTRTEVMSGKNIGEAFRLVLVKVHPDGPEHDELRYIVDPFARIDFGDFNAIDLVGNWDKEWARGGAPC